MRHRSQNNAICRFRLRDNLCRNGAALLRQCSKTDIGMGQLQVQIKAARGRLQYGKGCLHNLGANAVALQTQKPYFDAHRNGHGRST